MKMTFKCPRCGTEYPSGPRECDWCPGTETYERPRVFVTRAARRTAVAMLLGLAACTDEAFIQPGSEIKAILMCKEHEGINVLRTRGTWKEGESVLTVDCRDGTRISFYQPKRTR